MTTELDRLRAECEAARRRADKEKTPETREAAKAAWEAVEAAQPRRKGWGKGSRAGRQQEAERRAKYPWHPMTKKGSQRT